MINRKTRKKLRKKKYLKHKLEKIMKQRHRYNKKKKYKNKEINFSPDVSVRTKVTDRYKINQKIKSG